MFRNHGAKAHQEGGAPRKDGELGEGGQFSVITARVTWAFFEFHDQEPERSAAGDSGWAAKSAITSWVHLVFAVKRCVSNGRFLADCK
jgi:hypothetical protein